MGSSAKEDSISAKPGNETTRRRAGRPKHRVLSPELIAQAALERIDAQGYKSLTMPALAADLQVATSALYNHVRDKSDLLRLVQDRLMSQVDTTVFKKHRLKEAVRLWAHSYRDVFARHTPLIPIIAVMPVARAPLTLQVYEDVAAAFTKQHWPTELIVPSIVALESFIFGSAYDATAPADIFEVGEMGPQVPEFSAAVRATAGDSDPARTAFEQGLEALLTGLWQAAAAHKK